MADSEAMIPNHPAESVASLRHQRDLLGDALGRLLVKLGAASDVSMTGPELLLLAEDAIEELTWD